jgi:hypothetical protein
MQFVILHLSEEKYIMDVAHFLYPVNMNVSIDWPKLMVQSTHIQLSLMYVVPDRWLAK